MLSEEQLHWRRRGMVARQLADEGITSAPVLEAMLSVPRHRFVDPTLWDEAYEDRPLPIGERQMLSQPWMVARMLQVAGVGPGMRLLDVGTGSGYAAAVSRAAGALVWSVDRKAALLRVAGTRLAELGFGDIALRAADGALGWPEAAPFDAIVVSAGVAEVPPALVAQLAPAGRLVIPVGPRFAQFLECLTLEAGGLRREVLEPVRFVPLVEGPPELD